MIYVQFVKLLVVIKSQFLVDINVLMLNIPDRRLTHSFNTICWIYKIDYFLLVYNVEWHGQSTLTARKQPL